MTFFIPALFVISSAFAGKPTCGDGKLHSSEACEGSDLRGETCTSQGFDGGSLACGGDCQLDTSACTLAASATCGDGLVEDYEECDGADDTACPGACSEHCACPAASTGTLEIHMIDVGQGDGLLVVSPDGFTMLVDAGTDGQASNISSYMDAAGIYGLDYTLVTHMDADHVGGMDGVLASYTDTAVCFDHGGSYSTLEYSEYDAAADTRRLAVQTGDFIDMGPSMTVEVLHADTANSTENLNSVVILLQYGDVSMLVGGDCEEPCEQGLTTGSVDIYKVHHHGSSDSSSVELLEQMDPYTALISVGASNSFGHPDSTVLSRLAAAQATVYRTDLDGDIVVESDGVSYTVNSEAVCASGETRTCGDSDVGACSTGTRSCVDGMWGSCVGEVGPTDEDCTNGADDDCDGLTDEADPSCSSGASSVLISQVSYDTPGTDSIEEFVDLTNPTAAEIDIGSWQLADGAGSWSIPSGTTIAAGETLSIARDSVGFEALYDLVPDVTGLSLSLNNGGDVLTLSNTEGTEIDQVAWEGYLTGWSITAPTGDSIVRADSSTDTDTVSDWQVRSPAAPDGGSTPDTGGPPDTGDTSSCGDGVCDLGEDCETCAVDCIGVTRGSPSARYCCGNGTCEPAGEDSGVCPVDCN